MRSKPNLPLPLPLPKQSRSAQSPRPLQPRTKSTRHFIGAAVDLRTYRALQRAAKSQDRSVSSLLRQILSQGDYHLP